MMTEVAACGGDRLTLRGLRATGFHGVLSEERRDGQEFVVDVELGVNTTAAAGSDALADTVDYGGLAGDLYAALASEPVNLIETLAERLADLCLARRGVSWTTVTVHKPQAPLTVPFGDVSLTIHRSRDD